MAWSERFWKGAVAASLVAGFLLPGREARAEEGPAAPRRNTFYAELGGSGALASLNYDRLVSERVNLRFGVGGMPLIGPAIVAMPNLVFGQGRHRVEVGAGVLVVWPQGGQGVDAEMTAEVAYRFHSSHGFVVRASLGTLGTAPVPGVSVGWCF